MAGEDGRRAPGRGDAELTGTAAGRDEGGRPLRLFVAAWPPPEVGRLLAALRRPAVPGVRWTTPEQWHVTLEFLGAVAAPRVEALEGALRDGAAGFGRPPVARLGPATARLGRGVLSVPVRGLDDLAAAVRAACRAAPAGQDAPGDDHPFRGHLTLARGKGGRPVPASLAGARVEASWEVREVCLVGSRLEPAGARYATLARAPVGT